MIEWEQENLKLSKCSHLEPIDKPPNHRFSYSHLEPIDKPLTIGFYILT